MMPQTADYGSTRGAIDGRPEGLRTGAKARSFIPLLDYQRADVDDPSRFRWCCWARQTGKSFTKALRRLLRGIERRRTQVFLSAGERQSRELIEKVQQHCRVLGIAAQFIDDEVFEGTSFKKLEIRLPAGVRIIALPANPQTARGFSGDVFLDEFAMHYEDRPIWGAVFPTLLRGDGELDVASTPRGVKNVFAQLRDNEQFTHSMVTLPEAVEQGLAVEVETLRRSIADDELYRQEFLCEFLDESTAFLSYKQIAACEDAALDLRVPLAELRASEEDLFAGVDVGRHRDLTVIWLFARREKLSVTRGVIEMDRAPFREQYDQLAGILSLRCLRRCCIDAGGLGMQLAESAQEQFGRHRVEGVTFTAALKSMLAGRLRVAVEDRTIRIPADEAIRNDWHSLERRFSASGRIVLEPSRGERGHADRFWAAALALHAVDAAPAKIEGMGIRPLLFADRTLWLAAGALTLLGG